MPLTEFPFVTVQLPVYNESTVVERLIDAVAQLDYPRDRYEVQVLDDSTDETTAIIDHKVDQYAAQGLAITHLHRADRKGFKAGALQEGLALAKGEFISIFDADFVPPRNFLRCTLPYFADREIGMVQTRWDHINKNSSLLTHFQAFLLDAHFSVEQMGRNTAGYFINFSGTGGVWRKACMLDSGSWHTDTLTEDFDLSYRAQLKGWKFKYLEEVSVPAELPPVMSALKTQQYRWIKGNAETARKHVKQVMMQSDIPFKTKVHAFFHLTVGTVFICVFIASFLSIPLLFLKPHVPQLKTWFQYASFSLISLLFLSVFHYVATVHTGFTKQGPGYFFKTFPLYLSFSMGISLNNAIAVAEGWMGRKSVFIRTPKFNITDGKANSFVALPKRKNPLFIIEMLLAFYFLAGAGLGWYYNDFTMFPYHLMLAFGFGMMCYFAIVERQMVLRSAVK